MKEDSVPKGLEQVSSRVAELLPSVEAITLVTITMEGISHVNREAIVLVITIMMIIKPEDTSLAEVISHVAAISSARVAITITVVATAATVRVAMATTVRVAITITVVATATTVRVVMATITAVAITIVAAITRVATASTHRAIIPMRSTA